MNKRDEILDIMFKLFAEKGYEASMSDIAMLAKIKTPSIYSHFASKDELVMLVVEKEIRTYFEYIRSIIVETRASNFNTRIEHFYRSTINYYKTDNRIRFWRNISMINNIELRNRCRNLILENEHRNNEIYATFFQNAVESGEIKANNLQGSMFLFFALIRGVLDVTFLVDSTEMDMNNFADLAWQAYWEGLRA